MGFVARLSSAAIGILIVPLMLNALGTVGYGTYVTLTALAAWTQLGTLGIGKGMINSLVQCHAEHDQEKARRVVASLWGGIALALVAASSAIAVTFPFISWTKVLAVPPGLAVPDLEFAAALTIQFGMVALLASPAGIIYSAYQEEHKATLWGLARSAGALGAAVFAACWAPSMSGLALASGAAATVIGLSNVAWLFFRDKPFLKPRPGDFSLSLLRATLPQTFSFFLIDVAAILVFHIDKLIIIHFAGPNEVTEFELASKLFVFGYSFLVLVLGPLWPAVGEATRRHDARWAVLALRRVSVAAAVVMLGGTLLMVLIGNELVQFWSRRPEIVVGTGLFALIGTYFAVRAWTDTHAIVLFSMSAQRVVLASAIVHGLLNMVLGVILGERYGVRGVAAANLLGYVLTAGWFLTWQARTRLKTLDSAQT